MENLTKYANLNTLQTLVSALMAVMIVVMPYLGCTVDPSGTRVDCSASSFITPEIGFWVGIVLAALKFVVIPTMQPGGLVRNLFNPKVPVSTSGAEGTVKPAQIAKG